MDSYKLSGLDKTIFKNYNNAAKIKIRNLTIRFLIIAGGSLPHTLVFHLIDLGKKLQKAGFSNQPQSLSYSQATTLVVINSQREICQNEIADKLHLKPATIVSLVDELEKLKLVKRQQVVNNRRKYQIILTKQGNLLVGEITKQIKALENYLRNQLTPVEREKLYKTVEKLTSSLENWPTNISYKSPAKEVRT